MEPMTGSVERYIEQIDGVLDALVVHRSGIFSWFGGRAVEATLPLLRGLPAPAQRQARLQLLQRRLYTSFYCPGYAVPDSGEEEYAWEPDGFAAALSEANDGIGCWEEGWRVTGVGSSWAGGYTGGVMVQKGGLLVRPDQGWRHEVPTSGDPNEDGHLALFLQKELHALTPGFYMALGESYLSEQSARWLRLYWNVDSVGAIKLMQAATRSLNEAKIPFRLKVLLRIEDRVRCDAAVLYIRTADWEEVKGWTGDTYLRLPKLRRGVPALTRQLAPGLGLAEDPGQGASFGLHRCMLIAEGLFEAAEAGRRKRADRLEPVIRRFGIAGVRLQSPYLGLGPAGCDYPWPWETSSATHDGNTSVSTEASTSAPKACYTGDEAALFARAVESIYTGLASRAIWYEGQCNWLGPSPSNEVDESGQRGDLGSASGLAALGPDLYRGTAGIALFLGEYYSLSGEREARRAALGAIRHALRRIESIQGEDKIGLYTGWIGIACAAVRLGKLLGETWIVERGERLALQACALKPSREHDLLSGNAGTVLGFLELAGALDGPNHETLVGAAIELGRAIVQGGTRDETGTSWGTSRMRTASNLTGLSHGAAGIGCALLELFSATGENGFREEAERAFGYEKGRFDAEAQNWPDFRVGPRQVAFAYRRGRRTSSNYAIAWCHGAPGIALSRIRAHELLGHESYSREASVAIKTTERALLHTLAEGPPNFGLCHGVAGLAEIASYRRPNDSGAGVDDLACRAALYGAERFASGEHPSRWPLGPGAGPTGHQGLMVGLAGVGLFYLRLLNPKISSVLVPGKLL